MTGKGFTLLELLVALAIFAMMAVLAYSGLSTVLTVQANTDQLATQLAQLQVAFGWLGRDLQQQVARPIRDEYGDRQFSIRGESSYLELTRAGWRNPAQQPRSSLQRVAYRLEKDKLLREYWVVLDRAQDSQAIPLDLLEQVEALQFRFLDNQQQWHEQWPVSTKKPLTLKLIEVTLQVTQWGKLTRLFPLGNELPEDPEASLY